MLYPEKVYLLRGNHEWQGVSLSTSEGSFVDHIKERYPKEWDYVTDMFFKVFSYLSLAAIVDKRIFCVHGGIPRVFASDRLVNIMDHIEFLAKPLRDEGFPLFLSPYIVFDLVWSDPVSSERERPAPGILPPGFCTSRRDRDGSIRACTFEKEVLTQFLAEYKLEMIVRAHQCVSTGSIVVNNRQMITLFSSSGYDGRNNAGVLLVYNNKIHFLKMQFNRYTGRLQSYV